MATTMINWRLVERFCDASASVKPGIRCWCGEEISDDGKEKPLFATVWLAVDAKAFDLGSMLDHLRCGNEGKLKDGSVGPIMARVSLPKDRSEVSVSLSPVMAGEDAFAVLMDTFERCRLAHAAYVEKMAARVAAVAGVEQGAEAGEAVGDWLD